MPTYQFTCEVCGRHRKAWRKDSPPRFCSNECKKIGMVGQKCKQGKYAITPEMHEQIEKTYKRDTGNGQVAALAKRLNLPRWKVTRYAISQGWIAKQQKEPFWTDEETELLQRLARYCPEKIREKMKARGYNRTVNGIVLKMKRINARQNLNGQSARSFADCLGVDVHFVTRAIKAGRLKATKRGTARTEKQGGDMWHIPDSNARKYILEYLNEIDIRKVDKWWFCDLLADVG